MSNLYHDNAQKFNALSLRERSLFSTTILVAVGFVVWYFLLTPLFMQINAQGEQNQRMEDEINVTRDAVNGLRAKIAAGVHRDKELKLAQLKQSLDSIEEQLQVKTVELIDPQEMFQLMNQMIYKKSNLKLLSLKRREVKPAIAPSEGKTDEAGIYRHVLEVKFSGKYLDILKYMQSLEALDWKLIWDEIEINRENYKLITVKLLISTLSTRKEWVGV